MKHTRRISSVLSALCIVLLAATALMMSGCNTEPAGSVPAAVTTTTAAGTTTTAADVYEVRGTGNTAFYFIAVGTDGTETKFEVHTDEETVGEALLKLELIAGDVETYGLYVKTVNGETLDYATHGKYWAFYENGAYALAGVDSTTVVAGATYSFRPES